VARPHLPENVTGVSQLKDITIDQAVIGSCTNGRIEDIRAAARVLKGRKAAKGVRLIVIPATRQVYRTALDEGLFEIFLDAGAVISTPTCGPCLGGYMGVLAQGERAISTTNRNFVGRMGHPESEVYLASPAVAAASAVTGHITGPADL
jgi:3-isopropylmalate/(R)-2-methylmalate dehydratase large subunit